MLRLQNYLSVLVFLFAQLGFNLPSNSQAPTRITQNSQPSFLCGTYDNSPATILNVYTDETIPIPILVYKSQYFSSYDYTPQRRCEEISSRFQKLVIEKQKTYLLSGEINGIPVICVINKEENCSANNFLFTLHPSLTDVEQQKIQIKLSSNEVLYDTEFGFDNSRTTTIPLKPKTPKNFIPPSDIPNIFTPLFGNPTTMPPPPTKPPSTSPNPKK